MYNKYPKKEKIDQEEYQIYILQKKALQLFQYQINAEPMYYQNILVNLNSVINLLTREVIQNLFNKDRGKMKEFLITVTNAIKAFVMNNMDKRIVFYYSTNTDRYTSLFIKDFRKEQLDTYANPYTNYMLNAFIKVIGALQNASTRIHLIDTERVEPSLLADELCRTRSVESFLILSRDPMDFLVLAYDNVSLFDSVDIIEGGRNYHYEDNIRLPKIDIRVMSFFYRLRGIQRLKYIGARGLGEMKSIKYIQNNLKELLSNENIFCDDELMVFQYPKFISYMRDKSWLDSFDEKIKNI